MKYRVVLCSLFSALALSFSVFAHTPPPCSLPAPANLRMTAAGANWISIKWDPVAGAASYRVRAIQMPSGAPVPPLVVTTTEATLQNLAPGRYMIKVAAICSSGIVSLDEVSLTKSTIILDIVLNAQAPQGCIYTPIGGATHSEPWTGANCYIRVSQGEEEVYFQLKTSNSFNISMGKVSGWCSTLSGLPAPVEYPLNGFLTDQTGNMYPNPNTLTHVQVMEGSTLICKVFAWQVGQTFWSSVEEINTANGYAVQFLDAENLVPPLPENRDADGVSSLQLAPNPVNDVLRCRIQLAPESPARISLTGMDGSLWWTGTLPPQKDEQVLEIGTGHLPAGIYLLRLESGDEKKTQKVVVCRR
ncbi:MAG: T9SS type A sorting domain-containing protein [Saprospiraceae bacterium]|nr:T9SS type A sorting domain-containing protein [Saprospiraceae bacterium]